MKFLIDECLSTRVAELLNAAGHDAVHVVASGLAGTKDEQVMAFAVAEQRVLVSADTDFGQMLAYTGDLLPSVILLRRSDRRADAVATVLLSNVSDISHHLMAGCLIIIGEQRMRIRALPLDPRKPMDPGGPS